MKPSKTIKPLALPRGRQAVAAGARCSVAGWGVTHQGGQLTRALQELDMRVLDARMCNNSRFWNGDISPRMICLAAYSKNKAPCKVRALGWGAPHRPAAGHPGKPQLSPGPAPSIPWGS